MLKSQTDLLIEVYSTSAVFRMSNERSSGSVVTCPHIATFKEAHGLEPFKITQKWLVHCSTQEARQVTVLSS